ncbi:MAG: CBS domain-containing protein, partial [Bacteroidota bacterium]
MSTLGLLLQQKGHELWTIKPGATVFEALELLAEKNVGALPVVEAGQLVGIFSERDYARKVILRGKSSKNTMVWELMTPRVHHLRPDRSLEDAMRLMSDKRIRHLPIVDHGNILGIITIGDVVNHIISDGTFLLANDVIDDITN